MITRHFISVDRCNDNRRGIFCRGNGDAPSSDIPYTQEEIDECLGPFTLILNPKSIELTEEELKEYTTYTPLAEYSNEYGIVRK